MIDREDVSALARTAVLRLNKIKAKQFQEAIADLEAAR